MLDIKITNWSALFMVVIAAILLGSLVSGCGTPEPSIKYMVMGLA